MKRLLSMVLALAFSILNNVDYSTNADVVFTPDGYYKIEEGEAPDYRYLTKNYSDLSSGGTCIGVSSSRESAVLIHMSEMSNHKYWLDYSDMTVTEDVIETEHSSTDGYTFNKLTDIVAPQKCIVKSSSTGGDGHVMDLTTADGKYNFHITGMERWFCCRNKRLSADEDPMQVKWTHTVNIQDTAIPAGYLIGKATDGTRVAITDAAGRPVSIKDYYTN